MSEKIRDPEPNEPPEEAGELREDELQEVAGGVIPNETGGGCTDPYAPQMPGIDGW